MTRLLVLLALLGSGCGSRAALALEMGASIDGGGAPPPPPPTTKPPSADAGDSGDSGKWSCQQDALGRTFCRSDSGLPPNGEGWKCHLLRESEEGCWDCDKLRWICVGTGLPMGVPPGGGGWSCQQLSTPIQFRCEKLDGPGDVPPNSLNSTLCKTSTPSKLCFTCAKGSQLGGTLCEKVDGPPQVPTLHPGPGWACKEGEKVWCEDQQYDGWGQVPCDPATGKWKARSDSNGQQILDCSAFATGERPETPCACYYFFTNPICCERLDCKVPAGIKGQICGPSPGKLCDFCNPQKSECQGTKAKCIVTNTHETFCGVLCSPSEPCPSGYSCMVVKLNGDQQTTQCVPSDFSCYR